MSEFKTIETQEQFDEAIQDRLKREREKFDGFLSPEDEKKKYEGYLSPDQVTERYKDYVSKEDVEKQYAGYISKEEADKKDAMLKQYEKDSVKNRIAKAEGLSEEAVEFLKGETEEELKKSAQALKAVIGKRSVPPLRTNEQNKEGNDEALRGLLKNLRGE